jgi:hypothetical protein
MLSTGPDKFFQLS